jgi:uncharacterized RDD family membrane protein YckC
MSEPTGTQYGGFWVRLLALLADSAIVFLVSAALLVGAAMVLGPEELTPVMFAVWLPGFLYWPVMHASGGQATFGKAILGLKVARFDGRRISILRSLWRELAKIFSAAVLMLGYLMAAILPRKQGLHDLLAATYVVREGSARVTAALAVAVAGFALPVFVGPMVVDPALISSMTRVAEGMVPRQELMKMVAEHDLVKMVSEHDLMKMISQQDSVKQPVRPATPARKAPPKPQAQIAKAPAPKPEAAAPQPEAPKPEPVALAQPAPGPVAEPAKPAAVAEPAKPAAVAEPAKPKAKAAKPKAARTAKPKPAAPKAVARASTPAPAPPSTSKAGSGPRYNDLMTAVLYRDADSVNELLKLGKWPDKPDSRGVTPLMVAADLGDVRTAEALLRAGANARLAVPVAEDRSDGEMIQLLKRYAGR